MARSNKVTCIFCDQRRNGSDEHVISQWVRERLNITSSVTTLVEPSGEQHVDPFWTVKLRRTVCEDCNNGWMHELEDKVSPFLGPMLVHEGSVDLDAEQQRDLARWAVMKVLLLELAMRQQHPRRRPTHGYTPSEPELAWLYGKEEPPPRSRVWLGAFDGQNRLPGKTQARLFGVPMPDGTTTLPAHVTTLTIGQVIFQVFSIDFVSADLHQAPDFAGTAPEPFVQALTRIWPIEHLRMHWPQGFYITPDIFDRVVRWELRAPKLQ